MQHTHHPSRRGFTLLEIMVVVIMIGVLLAMAIPTFKAVRERTRVSVFLNDFRAVKEAINRYNLEEGSYPISGGGFTGDFADYLRSDIISNTTVIGGSWAVDDSTFTFALGVNDYKVDDELIAQIDEVLDDGDTSTGLMTITAANQFYFVFEE